VLILDLNEFINVNSGGNGLAFFCTILVHTALVITLTVTRCHVSARLLQRQLNYSREKCGIRIRPSQASCTDFYAQ